MDELNNWIDDFFSGAGGEVDSCWITLRFLGDDLDPETVTALMGVPPTTSCRKGERSNDGRSKQGPTGFWVLDCERTIDSADNQIQLLLREDLPQDLTIWRTLSEQFMAEVKINLLPAKWARGSIVSAETIQLLAERGLRLGIDIYIDRPPELQPKTTD